MRAKGKIISWNADKAFGFIAPCIASSKRIFIHKTAFANKGRTPVINDIITYTISQDTHGRTCATAASFAGEKRIKKQNINKYKLSLYLALGFVTVLIVSWLLGYLPQSVLIVYAVLSLLTYIVYAWDKSSARRGHWRTSESTLHLLALAGGWPGAAIAQQCLRHKSQKKDFRMIFWLTVVINMVALYWLVNASGLMSL